MKKLWSATQHPISRIEQGRRMRTTCIVVHDMESDNLPGVENFFRNSSPDAVGAHLGIDGTVRTPKVVQWADLDQVVFHAIGANRQSVGIELCGFAAQSRAKWILRRGQRIALAETLARLCHYYGLGLPTHGTNVLGHGDVSKKFNVPGGHTDPGPGFPWDAVIKLARKRYRKFYGNA